MTTMPFGAGGCGSDGINQRRALLPPQKLGRTGFGDGSARLGRWTLLVPATGDGSAR